MSDEKVLGILYRAQGASQVVSSTKEVQGALGGLTGHARNFASTLTTGVGNALSTFKSRLTSLATIGLGVGLFSIGGALEQSITKVEDFGTALEKVQTITGETARDSGALVLLFEKYGIGADQVGSLAAMAEKKLGTLNATTAKGAKTMKSAELQALELRKAYIELHGGSVKVIDKLITEQKARDQLAAAHTKTATGLTKLQVLDKEYGLQLVDSKGKVVNYSETLRQLANLYDNQAIPASTKAYVASQVLGKGFAALAPVFAQGSGAIRDAAAAADQLGLGSADTVKQLKDFRDSSRNLGESVNLLELGIGIKLLPVLNRLAQDATRFVSEHSADIAAWFGNAATTAENAGRALVDLGSKFMSFWDSLPKGLRDALFGAFVGDRAVKFLFGFDPAGIAIHLGADLLGGLTKSVASAVGAAVLSTKLAIQHVWVDNPGFGSGGGGPNLGNAAGDVALGAEGAGAVGAAGVGTLFAIGGTAIGIALAPYLVAALLPKNPANFTGRPTPLSHGFAPGSGPVPTSGALDPKLDHIAQVIDAQTGSNARHSESNEAHIVNAIVRKNMSVTTNVNVSMRATISNHENSKVQTTYKVYNSGSAGKYES